MLSYSVGYSMKKDHDFGDAVMASELVGVPGLEPGTSSLSGKRSNRLSYTPGGASRGASGSPRRLGYSTASPPRLAQRWAASGRRRAASPFRGG
jgi:hypothetical protein